jgi:molybdopterin biosynthesis enzyme
LPDVLAELVASCAPVEPQILPLAEAVGGILAEPLVLPAPVPARAIALRTGYAVSSRDLVGVSSYAPLMVSEPPSHVEPGDPLPSGCDAVLPPDALVRTGSLAEIVAAVAPGENARRAGEDGRAGEVLAEAGAVLHPLAAAAAMAAGLTDASVRLLRLGIDAEDMWQGSVLSRMAGVRLHRAERADVTVIVTDRFPADASGGRLIAPGLALHPGDATRVFLRDTQAVIVVPRRLDALLGVSLTLLRPLVDHLTGQSARVPWRRAPLIRKLASRVGFTEVALLRETKGGLEPLALGSLSLSAIAAAQGWLALPPESEGLQTGDIVDVDRL